MKPTADKILIEADKPTNKTESGILIHEDWKSLPPTGTIKAVGPEVKDLKPGDRVVFERYGSVIYKDDLRLCKQSHILATLDE